MKTEQRLPSAATEADRQKEIVTPGPLLDRHGRLAQTGWARFPYLDCNLENAGRRPRALFKALRLKRWDYYAVTTPELFVSITLADIGYVGTVFAYVVDSKSDARPEATILTPFGSGIKLERNADSGESKFNNGRVRVSFRADANKRRIRFRWPGFDKGKGLEGDFVLDCPPNHESVVTATSLGGRNFFYTRKVNCLPAAGQVAWGGRRLDLTPATALGTLDWGRGIWPYSTKWNWGSASVFLEDGRTLGLNIGSGFGNSNAPDNAIILAGRVHKLDQVAFGYDPRRLMKPWRMTSPDGRLELTFTPAKERVARTNLLLVRSEVHQIFGRYDGTLVMDDGERLEVQSLPGFIEEHQARW